LHSVILRASSGALRFDGLHLQPAAVSLAGFVLAYRLNPDRARAF
jgi:hypothetical protein